ncbi:hypothetical protein WG904_04500 [Pedobacter sp. Du54]|uniref:hypothetical protein n=1 Tax=Pedobacter anseongensis TaxID=3133439 RepID=UPI003097DA70
MIQKLSSFNIILAIVYVLVYLKSGTFNSTTGILVIIVFNWLGVRSFHLDNYRWGILHYLTGAWTLYFIGTLVYGAVNIVSASIEFDFITDDTLWYLIVNFFFCTLVMIQLTHYGYKYYKQLRKFNH